ncbi:MAG: hypothetical protein LBU27_06475 [Candidatus Peribacteria bacterium]|nr:hypothetical protein [Candidatus Peribacteria bacterium]
MGSATTILSISLNNNATFNTDKISNVHFKAGGNDFGGLILWQNTAEETRKIQVKDNNTAIGECKLRVEGLYYNAERGERLRPLDGKTRERFFKDQLLDTQMSGGLYTTCSGLMNDQWGYGIYGHLTHTYSGETYELVAGLKYDLQPNSAGTPLLQPQPSFGPTLQRYANQRPFGLIYDYKGGLGFVGCELSSTGLTKDIVNALNSS